MLKKALVLKKRDFKDELREYFGKARANLREKHRRRSKKHRAGFGIELCRERSQLCDEVIIRALKESGFTELKGVSVVALGGYGRYELCPYSDVDLLFLYKNRSKSLAKEIVETLLYFLWDFNIDVGHSVRTVDECEELSYDDDTTILTSLMDSRHVYGDENLSGKLDKTIYDGVLPKLSKKFIGSKLEESKNRVKRFGGSLYLLEPNIKEGEGGLRDIQSALWIAQAKYKIRNLSELLSNGFVSSKEYRIIEKCYNFLLSVRSELHYLAGRGEDRLSFDFQERVARFFGYRDAELRAVEKFMRVYYLRARLSHRQAERIIDGCLNLSRPSTNSKKTRYLDNGFTVQGGFLSVTSRNVFKDDPVNLMRAFEYSVNFDVEMSRYLTWLIWENSIYIDDTVRRNKEFNNIFLRLLRTGKNVAKTLFLMNELRVLAHYIPEFGKIVCMVQHDAYHVYTVDVHSITMVREIENLINYKYEEEFPLLTKIAESVIKRDVLYLACLIHDAGKGAGKNHSEKGAVMAPVIAERMGLNRQETKQLEFLVKHHLIMPHYSQRRDLHDMSLIERFAHMVKSLETLTLLYLLTFADIRSVGPDVWTNWKGMLLRELYLRTGKYLELGEFTVESIEKRNEQVIKRTLKRIGDDIPEKKVRKILSNMPDSYFFAHSPKSIANHIKIVNKAGSKTFTDLVDYPREEYDEFIFWGKDEKGIIHKVCGVLNASNVNILGARIVTTNDNRVLDVFYVNKLGKSTSDQKEIWDKIGSNLKDVLKGKLDVNDLVNKRKSKDSQYKKIIPKYPPRIEVDNSSSENSTVIDIYTHDRTGLLYDVTKTLNKLRLNVNYAKISTKVDQVVDVLYVSNSKGKKIEDKKRLERIKNSLMESLIN
ncbi:MAG: [protein-PII] uridylyltransferase [Thermodesulfobacteriota bacterium]